MNNIFPNDPDNIWNVYGSPPPNPNVALQTPMSLSSSSSIEDQMNLCQIPNSQESPRPNNMYGTAPFYSPAPSPNPMQMYSPRGMVPQSTRSRHQKQHEFTFPSSQQQQQQQQMEPENGKTWKNNNVFTALKSPDSVMNNNKSPDLSPHQNYISTNQMDIFSKQMIDNSVVDPNTGQLYPLGYSGNDSNKIGSAMAKNQKDVQQQQQLYLQQLAQQYQQQLNVYSNKQLQQTAQQQQMIQQQLQQQQQQLQQQQQQNQERQHQQQLLAQHNRQQLQQQQQQQHQKQLQQEKQQSNKLVTKQQQLQRDKNQKSNVNTVFSNLNTKSPPGGKSFAAKNDPANSRYDTTLNALKQAGLLDITMQTGELLKKNISLQKDIDMLEEIVKVTNHLMTTSEAS